MKTRLAKPKSRLKFLLALDVGNTLIKIGVFRNGKIIEHFQLVTNRERTPDELGLQLRALVAGAQLSPENLDGVIISSVVPHLNERLDQAFKRHLRLDPHFFDYRWGLLRLEVDEPSKVGNDRLADSLAGFTLYGGPLLVLNFGTATTFNLISKEGVYLGGAIAPQMETSAHALFQRAAQLYEIQLAYPKNVIGKNTAEHIRAGFVMGFIDLVSGLIRRYKLEIKESTLKAIATGGLGEFFAKHTPEISEYDPYLTLKGLAIAWEKMPKKR